MPSKSGMNQFTLCALIYKHKSCQVCDRKHNQAKMVLCDRCEDAYHTQCIHLSSVPKGSWVCPPCTFDVQTLKLNLEREKREKEMFSKNFERCSRCELGLNEIPIEMRGINNQFLSCQHCKQKFHFICFSDRTNSLNCRECEDFIREKVPKGHSEFVSYIQDQKYKMMNKKYCEVFEDTERNTEKSHLCYNFLLPLPTTDWRVICSYEASLAYALLTRSMIYSDNLIFELSQQKLNLILLAHKNSIEKIYRLCKNDESSYEKYKKNLDEGIYPPLEVKEDRVKGFHVVSTDFIPKNTIICEYVGEIKTARESLNLIKNQSIFTLIRNPKSSQSLDIAPQQFGNIAIFFSGINNSDKKSEQLENIRALKFQYKGTAKILFYSIQDIGPNQILYMNYNGDQAYSEYPTNTFVK